MVLAVRVWVRAVGVSVEDVRACGGVFGCVSVRACQWGVRECFRASGVFQCRVTASSVEGVHECVGVVRVCVSVFVGCSSVV